jgi:hypothetical protein
MPKLSKSMQVNSAQFEVFVSSEEKTSTDDLAWFMQK